MSLVALGGLVLPLAVAATFGGGFLMNEWSHGGMAEAMGLGHHHMLDYGGVHCLPPDDGARLAAHMDPHAPMHGPCATGLTGGGR